MGRLLTRPVDATLVRGIGVIVLITILAAGMDWGTIGCAACAIALGATATEWDAGIIARSCP